MFLVLLRHSMDDLPIALFEDLADARDYADKVEWYPSEQIKNVFNLDSSTPNNICIVELGQDLNHDIGGHRRFFPISCSLVRMIEDDAA